MSACRETLLNPYSFSSNDLKSNGRLIDTEMRNPPTAPTATVPPEEMQLLLKSIRRIVRASDLGSRSLQKTSGLTASQLAVLTAVGGAAEISSSAIAAQVDLSPATVVTVLDNLERQGLVQRHRSSEDRRVVFTRLTERGAAMLAGARDPFGEAFAREIAGLPPNRRRQMIESLAALADLMNMPEGTRA